MLDFAHVRWANVVANLLFWGAKNSGVAHFLVISVLLVRFDLRCYAFFPELYSKIEAEYDRSPWGHLSKRFGINGGQMDFCYSTV